MSSIVEERRESDEFSRASVERAAPAPDKGSGLLSGREAAEASALDEALVYAELGFSPIPLCRPVTLWVEPSIEPGCYHERYHKRLKPNGGCESRGKVPLVHWSDYQDRRPSEATIRSWFSRWPDANVGIVTGAQSGVVVLDADSPEAIVFVEEHGGVSDAPCQETGKGRHWFFQCPEGQRLGNRVKLFGQRIDFRGDGGFVVIAPSLHCSGNHYRWVRRPDAGGLPPIPDWLMEELARPGKPADSGKSGEWSGERLDLRQFLLGVPEGQRDEALYKYACSLQARGYEKADALLVVTAAAERCNPPFEAEVAEEKVRRVYDRFGDPLPAVYASFNDVSDGADRDGRSRGQLRLLTAQEMKRLPPPVPLIDGVLFRDSLAVMDGPPGSFKSFIALDMALSIAAGVAWQDRGVHQGAVVYITAEGASGMSQRIRAWENAHKRLAAENCRFLPEAVNFLDAHAVAALCAAIKSLPDNPVLVVIDTLARSMPGGEENSSRDMGLMVSGMDAVRRTADGAAVLALHHVNRGKGEIRGHSSLLGALDTEMKVARRNASTVILSCEKQKDAPEFPEIVLVTHSIVLDDGGSSLALVQGECQVSPQTLVQNRALELLDEFFGDDGATFTQWKGVCEAHGINETALVRARKQLLELGAIAKVGPDRGGKYVPRRVEARVA